MSEVEILGTGPEGKIFEIPRRLVFSSGPVAGEEGRPGGPGILTINNGSHEDPEMGVRVWHGFPGGVSALLHPREQDPTRLPSENSVKIL
jgi:hypothetical protein